MYPNNNDKLGHRALNHNGREINHASRPGRCRDFDLTQPTNPASLFFSIFFFSGRIFRYSR